MMDRRELLRGLAGAAVAGMAADAMAQPTHASGAMGGAPDAEGGAVYQLRVYHTYEGKLDGLLARFRDHTMAIFERHGMRNVGYWLPTDEPLKGRTLVYMLAHKSRAAADASWQAFHDDPEWKAVSAASEANGKLVEKVDSTFMVLTDFSPKV